MPKLKHLDDDHSVRYITFSCFHRQQYLNNDIAKKLLIEQIDISRINNNFKLLGYVLMPEHVHLVIFPETGTKIGTLLGSIKKRMSKRYFQIIDINTASKRYVFWEKRCYDHNCRSTETVREKIKYCHNNPVKRGLVDNPGDWRWSSHNWYCGNRDVPILIDAYEL
jgi:putative transposase